MTADTLLTPHGDYTAPASPTMNGNLKAKGIVVFSGGSAANNLVDVFKTVREDKKCPLSYVIPISDNGGSSSELIRVFGGPGMHRSRDRKQKNVLTYKGIGDVRSTMSLRLINSTFSY